MKATIKRADDLNIGDGAKKRHVTAYLIEGLGFSPSTVWLDDEQRVLCGVGQLGSIPSCARAGKRACRSCIEKQESDSRARAPSTWLAR